MTLRPPPDSPQAADGLSYMRAIRDGRTRPPPMADHVGIRCTEAEAGRIVAALDHAPELENSDGMLHGGTTATLLDVVMGGAAHTLVAANDIVATVDMTVSYLKPIRRAQMPVVATAQVVNRGRRTLFVEARVHDRDGVLVAHGIANFRAALGARTGAGTAAPEPEVGHG